MTYEGFWYEDVKLFNAYLKAYQEDVQYKAWVNGYFNNIAHSVSLANAFKEKGKPSVEYPEYRSSVSKPHNNSNKPTDNNDYEYLSMFY